MGRDAAEAAFFNDFATWSGEIQRLQQTESELRSESLWLRGRDDFLGVLRRQRRETTHCAMIAWLLDPLARHGLGTAFLTRFLRGAFGDAAFADLDQTRTRCEESWALSRADIVIRAPGLTVVVEAKIGAGEGHEQCARLHADFEKDEGVRFLLLMPYSDRSRFRPCPELDAFATLTFRDLRTALRDALATTPPRPAYTARHIAQDYLRTLDLEFP